MRLLSVVLLPLFACSADDFSLSLRLATEQSTCQSGRCSDYAIQCEATVLVRLTNDNNEVIAEACQAISGDDLCALGDIDIDFPNVATGTARVEFAVFNSAQLGGPTDCPEGQLFDQSGRPLPQWPPIAFGGATFADIGSNERIEIALDCPSPQTVSAQCNIDPTTVGVRNLHTDLSVSEMRALGLQVAVTEPTVDVPTEPAKVENAAVFLPVMPTPARPTWEGVFAANARVCVTAADAVARTVECYVSPQNFLIGHVIDEQQKARILTALGASAFPQQGIVVGIVLDSIGLPAVGASVTSTSGTVQYLDDNDQFSGVTTEQSGIFVSTDAFYDSSFVAQKTAVQSAQVLGGRVANHVSIVVLRLP